MKYLHLIRFKSLLILVFMQLVLRFGFLKLNNVELALTNFQYILLMLSTVLIAAGGYVINAIFNNDLNNTTIKNAADKQLITENTAYNIYFGLNVTGVAVGYYLSNAIFRPSFLVFFILASTLLYFYASQLKQIALLGNIVIAFLKAFCIIIIGFFDLFPATDLANQTIMRSYFSILIDFSLMLFLLSLMQQIVKDLISYSIDNDNGTRTFPVVFGIKKTKFLLYLLLGISAILIILYVNNYLMKNELYFATVYVLFLIIAPIVYIFVRLFDAQNKASFEHLFTVLQFVFLAEVTAIFIISKNIIYHVNA